MHLQTCMNERTMVDSNGPYCMACGQEICYSQLCDLANRRMPDNKTPAHASDRTIQLQSPIINSPPSTIRYSPLGTSPKYPSLYSILPERRHQERRSLVPWHQPFITPEEEDSRHILITERSRSRTPFQSQTTKRTERRLDFSTEPLLPRNLDNRRNRNRQKQDSPPNRFLYGRLLRERQH